MGANAQTSVPTFTAGEILTAANMNISARTGIPVFADSTARDAAFGGTGEKTLAEGQFAYLEDSNTTQYYDGSTWQTVGVTPGLRFITGATFTTATSFSLPNDTFTATYRNYRMIVNLTALTADADFSLRVRASGTDNTTSNYFDATTGFTSTNVASNVGTGSQTSWSVGECDNGASLLYNLVLDIMQPNIAARKTCVGQVNFINKAANAFIGRSLGLSLDIGTAVDSLSFISSVASSMTGVYRVYGYSES